MRRPRSRAVLLLCVLLALQEFGPAYFAYIRPVGHSRLERQTDESEDGEIMAYVVTDPGYVYVIWCKKNGRGREGKKRIFVIV